VRATALSATLLALLLSACAPAEAPAPKALALDCSQAFEAEAARLVAQPLLVPAPQGRGEPYRFYSTDDGSASYLITQQGAPAHPAIMMQRAMGGEVKTTGCPYGDRKGYDQLMTYLDSLKTWTRR
jgi:hypothetical protein